MSYQTDDVRILGMKDVLSPEKLHTDVPMTEAAAKTCFEARQAVHQVLNKKDDRVLVVVGPCSIHDVDSALDYAQKLKPLIAKHQNDLLIVMRVYFEKPRTIVGWKGLINDPELNGEFNINKGLHLARKLLMDINHMGVPAGTEFLDLISPQYVADVISWGAIGARTTESQVHRELASGLSCPVGFKNATDGGLQVAIDAIMSSSNPHHFLSVTKEGHSAIFSTSGNEDCHIILRGGKETNYDAVSVATAAVALEKSHLQPNIMVDFSHANSCKQFKRQMNVGADVAQQIAYGDGRIVGTMIESHLNEGRQNLVEGESLAYGQSITDACIGWDDTVNLLETLAKAVRERRN
ncbi:MAG: 3-deoxy-7-phosphoheptulonate synthase AroG [Mariprofundaceae bacterium]|nr:3-deoxy-7-phosphoheptulonate synthase AroG [Mariprofundaceae bacterium]